MILGIIGALVLANQYGKVVDYAYGGKIYYARNWGLTLGIFFGSALGCFAVFCILLGISEVLERQEMIQARLSQLESNVMASGSKIERIASSTANAGANEWKCEKCGRINPNTVGTCGCGQSKP